MEMTYEWAAEILDPEHLENYSSETRRSKRLDETEVPEVRR